MPLLSQKDRERALKEFNALDVNISGRTVKTIRDALNEHCRDEIINNMADNLQAIRVLMQKGAYDAAKKRVEQGIVYNDKQKTDNLR